MVISAHKLFLQLSELSGFVESLGSVGVEVTEAVEVLGSEGLASGVAHVGSVEGIVNDLNCFPVTLCLEKLVHDFFSGVVAIGHDPSVEANKPNLFQKDFDFT